MPINIAEEKVFPLGEVPDHVPKRRGGKKLNASTAFRWHSNGLRGIKLEVVRVGGTMCTSDEALQRFFDRLTAADSPQATSPEIRTSAERAREIWKAEAELHRRGC